MPTPRSLIVLGITSGVTGVLLLVLLLRLLSAQQMVTSASGFQLAGRAAPDFTITTWNTTPQRRLRLATLKGHPVLVNFWASWCDACREEAPVLQAMWQTYQSQGVVFIDIAFRDQPDVGAAFLRQYGITYPSGPPNALATPIDYGVTGIPETVFIDQHGIVLSKFSGAIDDASLDRTLRALVRSPSWETGAVACGAL